MDEKENKIENLENKDVVLSDGEALGIGFPTVSEMGSGPDIPPENEGDEIETQTILQPVPLQSSDTIANMDNVGAVKVSGGESQEQENKPSDKEGKFALHGTAIVGHGVAGDSDEKLTERPAVTVVVDLSHKPTGLGFSAVRVDDFHNDPEQPLSRVTVLNPHYNKNFGKKGEFGVAVEGKYTLIDNLPEANGFGPDVVLSYNAGGGRNFEGMYTHKFLSGKDSDAFRLSVSKKINEAIRLTGQCWYETGYDKHFYGRVIMDINLGNGFGAQISCMAKHGQLTPTAGIVYNKGISFGK